VALEWQAAGLPTLLSDAITRDCAFVPGVQFLPLEVQAWADAIENIRFVDRAAASREGVKAIADAGYDLTVAAAQLQADYRKFARR
jgi:hypothetical protein